MFGQLVSQEGKLIKLQNLINIQENEGKAFTNKPARGNSL